MKRVDFRRKREGKTNYRKRIIMLSSHDNRLVARIGGRNIVAQIIQYSEVGDKVVVTAHASELKALGWKYSCSNTSAAYLMGYLIGTKAKRMKIEHAIFDIGLKNSVQKSKIFAFLKGAVDSKLVVPHGEEAFPSEDRISGKHVEELAKLKASNSKSQFSKYAKAGANPENMSKVFAEVKAKIK